MFRNEFDPLPWQIAPWQDQAKCILLTGGAGGGKSRIAAEKCHAYCLRYPGSNVLILRKLRQSMINSTVSYINSVVLKNQPWVKHKKSEFHWAYPNGSKLLYGGMADPKQREHIRSIGQDGGVELIWMEEATAFVGEDYDEILGRLRGKAGPWTQLLLTTNPDAPEHWIYKRLIQGNESHVYYSLATDNPYNPEEYVRDRLSAISGVRGIRLREGRWIRAEGAVFSEWDYSRHVIARNNIPHTWRKIRCIDFGYKNPFVCLWLALDPETNTVYVYRELYMSEILVEDAAKLIANCSLGEEIEATICDHDAEGRATLERHGISTRAAFKSITPGIEQMKTRFRQNKILYCINSLLQEDPALVERYLPTSVSQELALYQYPRIQEGKLLGKKQEIPIKKDDHGIDALRYGICYFDNVTDEQYGALNDFFLLNPNKYVRPSQNFRLS